MSDIVERLREKVLWYHQQDQDNITYAGRAHRDLFAQAAAEIERLRAALTRLIDTVQAGEDPNCPAYGHDLRRARSALTPEKRDER